MKEPILVYPDPELPYTLFTDASKYAWAAVLTQAYNYDKENKQITINHPITFASGLFKGSQLNWAALTKEAYAIYMAVKKLNYYLEDADVTLMSDHLPLKKFLQRNTMNTKCCDMGHVEDVKDIADIPIGHNAIFVEDVEDITKMSR